MDDDFLTLEIPRRPVPNVQLTLPPGLEADGAMDLASPRDDAVHVFVDESISKDCGRLYVGAVVARDVHAMFDAVEARQRKVLRADQYWDTDAKRRRFQTRGFHHTEDSETVRQALIDLLPQIDFRAHVWFVDRERVSPANDDQLFTAMLHAMAMSLLVRYTKSEKLTFVFEENQKINGLYAKIVGQAREDVKSEPEDVEVFLAKKPNPGVSIVDYVLAVTQSMDATSDGETSPFRRNRVSALRPHLAHLVDFGALLHRSARRSNI